MPMTTAPVLPVELLVKVFLCVDPYALRAKTTLAAVSSYWRAAALDSGLLWSSFQLDCHTAHILPLLLERGRGAPLDIVLDFGAKEQRWSESDADPRTGIALTWQARDQCALLLADDRIRPRLERLKLRFNAPGVFNITLGSHLHFPNLEHVEILRETTSLSDNLSLLVDAPRLRQVRLCRVDPRNWDCLLVRGLQELHVEHSPGEVHFGLLGKAAQMCPLLRRLTLATYNAPPPGIARVLLSRAEMSLIAQPAGSSALDGEDAEGQLLHRLQSFELEVPNDASSLRIFDSFASANICPFRMSTSVRNGWASPSTLAVFTSLLRGLGSISGFKLDAAQVLTLSDDNNRERSFRVWDVRSPWEMASIWDWLVKEHGADGSMKKVIIAEQHRAVVHAMTAAHPLTGDCLIEEI